MTIQDRVAQIFSESRTEIYRYVVSLGLDLGQAQEVTQDAFLRLYLVLEKGEQIDNERAWLFRVAHNLGVNARLKNNRSEPLPPGIEDEIPDPASNPEQTLLEGDKRRRLRKAIGELSEQQRQCLHLRAEGLRYREIATVIGIKTSTVSEYVRRAISKLRNARNE